ncbi:restriction endonuclease subunit S [Halobacteria archaeon AArc-m2/3/4]|uniref:Restriction endonuclease subunit S n=1 Tax=Natronoglomus mannanivorans TaxID=2979990 RepID=A0ABT2QIV2_9EURY|nr:restriction endonuclease subunit S [Halobacteria archaeon AArc-m2/3/4]
MSEAVEVEEIPAGFRQTQLGPRTITVPEHWSRVRIEDVSEVVTRGKQPTYVDEPGVPVLNQSCIYWDGYHQENLKYLDEDVAKDWKPKHFATKGDILINSTGQGTLGRALYWDKESGTHAIDSHITRVSVDSDTIDPEFLRYYLESTWGQTMLYVFCVAGSTGQIELSKTDLMSMPLLCPPVEEQRRIADILSTVDEQIQQTDEVINKTEELKRGVLNELIPRGINEHGELRPFPEDQPDLYDEVRRCTIPTGWEVSSLQELCKEDVTYGIVQAGPHVDDGVPYIKTGDMTDGKLELKGLSRTSTEIAEDYDRSKIRTGELVITIRATVGVVHQVPPELDGGNLTQGTARISPKDSIDNRYLLWAIRTNIVQSLIDARTKGSTFNEITLGTLRKVPIPYPVNLEEQKIIAERLDKISEKLDEERSYLHNLQELKDGLMQDLLTGKVRVNTDN